MNHWYRMRRLRGAVILITFGVLALLSQWHIMRFEVSWPVILIVLGFMKIAERAAWSADLREQQQGQQFKPGIPSPAGPRFVSPYPGNSSYWSASSPSVGAEQPPVSTPPPTPEDFGREDR